VRKSIRFELGSAPVTIQLSGATAGTLRIAVRSAAPD
jgi:hypothetical protein